MNMNIEQAKKQLIQAIEAYQETDVYGRPVIPTEKQRPIILMGPPGIGKTAIMEQIAGELGIGLVSYSMTHHTRQSALGLPFIEDQTFCGKNYKVSRYTMSEIIAAVYNKIENENCPRGILFLDEINCVSETLAPAMLQFLQYKVFGMHRLPDGWVVVTAGNPQEYNDSARDFDVVTWDRLKRMDISPDYEAWKRYVSSGAGVHPAITSFLATYHAEAFHKVESTVDGKRFVTPRGWNDLSAMMTIYEAKGFVVDYDLIRQYIQNDEIASKFRAAYDLYRKYSSDYKVDDILNNRVSEVIIERARKAKEASMTYNSQNRGESISECYALVNMMVSAVATEARGVYIETEAIRETKSALEWALGSGCGIRVALSEILAKKRKELDNGSASGAMNADKQEVYRAVIAFAEQISAELLDMEEDAAKQFIRDAHNSVVEHNKASSDALVEHIDNMYVFAGKAFGASSQEIESITADLTGNNYIVKKLWHSKEYFKYCKMLKVSSGMENLKNAIKNDDVETYEI